MFGDLSRGERRWPTAKLGKLCDISRGGSPRPISEYLGGDVPWIKIGDATDGDSVYLSSTKEHIIQAGVSKSKVVKPGSLIFANCGVSLGFARIITFEGCIHDGWLAFENIDERLDKVFLLKSLNQMTENFRSIAPTGTQPNLNIAIMQGYDQIMPPLSLQRQYISIVDQLDKSKQSRLARLLWAVEDARKAYQTLIQRSEELVKSQFIESFGDIISNDRKWPEKLLGEVAESRLGKMVDANKQTGKCLFPYIANFNVQWFSLSLEDLRSMDFVPEDQEEFSLRDGDLLVCEGGEVGRCAIWHNEIQPCFFQKAIHRIRCNNQYLIPEYLAYWFKSHSDYNQFEDVVGAKTSIAHLPGVKLKKLRIPLPPIDKQKAFKTVWGQLDKSKYVARKVTCLLHCVL